MSELEIRVMKKVGFVGWRGMVGSVLMERMLAEGDFKHIEEPVFFTTSNAGGQGPDIGPQYLSVAFYRGDAQKAVAEKVMGTLREKGYKVATQLMPSQTFWPAEAYHQDYYVKTGKAPYCHAYRKIFDD